MERVRPIPHHLQLHARTTRGRVDSLTWKLPDDLSKDEWIEAGIVLARIGEGVMWWIGDYWIYRGKEIRRWQGHRRRSELAGAILPDLRRCCFGLSSIRNFPSAGSSELRTSCRGSRATQELSRLRVWQLQPHHLLIPRKYLLDHPIRHEVGSANDLSPPNAARLSFRSSTRWRRLATRPTGGRQPGTPALTTRHRRGQQWPEAEAASSCRRRGH